MRTKHIALFIIAALLAIALAVFAWRQFRAPAVDTPVEEAAPVELLEQVDPEPVFSDDDAATQVPSPQGLYDDLDAALERAGEKPELTLDRVEPPTLTPPQRAPDDEEKAPDPA